MREQDLTQYCLWAEERGATDTKQIHPSSVVTAPWVPLKCQFGCPYYGKNYCCPPDTPTPERMRAVLDSYRRAILFHIEAPKRPDRGKRFRDFFDMLVTLEGELFKDGFYSALLLVAGPCRICNVCGKAEGRPCSFMERARPSMESCGIDVYQTVRNNGSTIKPLRERDETQNQFCLMLVD